MTASAFVIAMLLIHVGVILVVTAYYTVGAVLAPGVTERARIRFADRPWLAVLIGLAISVPWVVAALALLNADFAAVKFIGAALGCLWIFLGLMGGAGIAQHVGRTDAGASPSWTQTVRGGLCISLTWLLPLVGWLGMLPLTMAAGVGCVVLGLFPMRQPEVAA